MFDSRAGFLGTADQMSPFPVGSNPRWRPAARVALFNLVAHELHELYYDIGLFLILKDALDRLRVRLNMYLVLSKANKVHCQFIQCIQIFCKISMSSGR